MQNKRFTIRLIVALIAFSPLIATADSLADKIDGLISTKNRSRTLYTIHFRDIASDQTIYKFNADRPQKPASNMKIITTAVALDTLGPDFQYDTLYGIAGDDLAVIASGDPLIGDPVLAEQRGQDIFQVFDVLAAKLKENNIDFIKGNLIIDDSIFDNKYFHKSWDPDQANRWYAAEVAGLSFNDNCIDILFEPAAIGQMARYSLMPDTKFIDITNKCKTIAKGSTKVGALRAINSNNVTLIGQCQSKRTVPIYLAIHQPSALHGFVLAERLLSKHGIKIQGKLIIKKITDKQNNPPEGFKTLLIHQTQLSTVLDQCNQRSLNLAAEALFKTIGTRSPGPDSDKIVNQGSWESGRKNIEAFLQRLNIPVDQFKIDDGSGLSHNNKISAEAMTTILTYMYKHKNSSVYLESFATPETGTLAKRSRFSEYDNRIYAKTGSISGVNSLSGYCQDKQGRWMAFSILTNSPSASNSTIDQIVKYCMDNE
ncbi:MAG: D-alanyl-D-alanine carboxypeptidase/D-alanyl-D-alanine-endopeptidase [Phycisphaerae bacterium]|nr:D-alanyl-D-alanine carboxypeptidase/D-alanyl-D-alanine-endopeptidase [Phycisphaerae bacterium]